MLPAQDLFQINPPELTFDSSGRLNIVAPASSSKHDFDFLTGHNKIHHRVLKSRLSGSNDWREYHATSHAQVLLEAAVNQEIYQLINAQGRAYEGMALRLFDPSARLWSIYWTQSDLGVLGQPPEVGYFENRVGFFFSQDVSNGKPVITLFRWDAGTPGKPVWSQALSEDNGKSWEWNWHMIYTK